MKKICYNWSISLLIGLFSLFFLSSIGFLFGLTVNPIYPVISTALSVFTLWFLTVKTDKFSSKNFFAQLIVLFDLILIFGAVCYFIPDFSYDGTTYHQASIIWLKWGWNPVYIKLSTFANSMPYQFPSSMEYGQHFLKFFEIIGANIYALTGKIELTKLTNFILALSAFCYAFYSIKNYKNLSDWQVGIFAFLFVFNPVCICQMLTNYVDCAFYYVFLILMFALINYTKNQDRNALVMVVMSSVIFANVKLTGLFTVLIMLMVFLIAFFTKKLLKISILVGVLILLTGINPYVTNMINGYNPLYPVVKESFLNANKEYMTTSYPTGFENSNRFKKLFISLFSSSRNLSPLINTDKPTLKVPFTITNDDIFHFEDMRVGGFGYFFSGILLCSLILSMFLRFKDKEDKRLFFVIMAILMLSILGNHEAWWARFVPQMWSLPLFIMLFFLYNEQFNGKKRVLISILFLITFLNSSIVVKQYVSDRVGLAFQRVEWINSIKLQGGQIMITKEEKQQIPLFETMPVKLEEQGIKVLNGE